MASSPTRRTSGYASIGLVLLVVLGIWLGNGRNPGTSTGLDGDPAPSAIASSAGRFEPGTGLRYIDVGTLPPEAISTIALIDREGPYPYSEDGTTFGNYEGLLPAEPGGYYREFTVRTPGSDDRGARRIIAGDGGELYWTQDHYASFSRIRR